MTRYLASLLLALVAPVAVHAQTHRLTTGVLPAGARFMQVSQTERTMHAIRSPDPGPFSMTSTARDSSLVRILRSGHAGADELVDTHLGGYSRLQATMDDQPQEERANAIGTFQPGTRIRTVRDGLQWVYHFPQLPEPLRGEALAAAWETRAPRIGESWTLPADTLARMFASLTDTAAFFRVTLDSVGVSGGGPVAFLSYAFDVTTVDADGGREHRRQSGTVVRRTDLGLDVRMEYRTETASTVERSDGYRARVRTSSYTVVHRSVYAGPR